MATNLRISSHGIDSEGSEEPTPSSAIVIQIDYSHDTSGFFSNNPAARAQLQQAADTLAGQFSTSLPATTPGGVSTWAETFHDPSTGQLTPVANASLAANTIVVYAGARELGGGLTSVGGPGEDAITDTQDWHNLLQSREPGGVGRFWGRVITFDTTTNWWFGSSATGMGSAQIDFLTCATRELGHLLGFSTPTRQRDRKGNLTTTSPRNEATDMGPNPSALGIEETGRLATELIRLEKGFPPPDPEAIRADCRWLQEHWGTGELASYQGRHVAILNGKVVGSGDNAIQLEIELARKLEVHPQRLVIEYIPAHSDF